MGCFYKRTYSVILLIFSLVTSSFTQAINYSELFGENWKKAEAFERENRSWMEPVLEKNHISYPIAIAVIFPELVRYSALRDKMEITLLKALYVNLGKDYANFSIGQFQMKPSFAEKIHEMAPAVLNRRSGITFKGPSDFDDIKNYRKSIIVDLEDPLTQFNYLVSFLKICEKKFKNTGRNDVTTVKFLAAAYNYGVEKSADQIGSMIEKKFFSTKLYSTETYCYSDISAFWYKEYMTGK